MTKFKKIIFILLLILFARSIIHDMTTGIATSTSSTANNTAESDVEVKVPAKKEKQVNKEKNNEAKVDYKPVSHTVSAGDTVLSIAEKVNSRSIPIQKILEDFQTLNPDADPHNIRIGETYFFPEYIEE
ncbi:LysM peptidoglycan-binding domain-containing protein [Salinibacillus xinjiangensis]|uniref:LysM peptidoglycan-binding domain-containing protein n=1 Tax=Salinibacillus xinjiangensis TaxID=1229268 RepID=A0A6G1X6Q6_9BACI|nr:LysM domain-containing protein [Salinibacillus xinjiangensis]MRG86609.1 LysM peptidoglycan-binding domain-containing protein [Salinibacillus xinjiangensis]